MPLSVCLSPSLTIYLSISRSLFFRRRVVPNLGKEEASWKALGVLIDLSDSVVFGVAFFYAFPAGCHDVQLFFLFSVLCLFLLLLLCFLFIFFTVFFSSDPSFSFSFYLYALEDELAFSKTFPFPRRRNVDVGEDSSSIFPNKSRRADFYSSLILQHTRAEQDLSGYLRIYIFLSSFHPLGEIASPVWRNRLCDTTLPLALSKSSMLAITTSSGIARVVRLLQMTDKVGSLSFFLVGEMRKLRPP